MPIDELTNNSYNENAATFAERFSNERVLTEKLDTLFSMVRQNPNVLDIGCGNGKYAKSVMERGGRYQGMDGSDRLIEIGEAQNPEVEFFVGDMITAEYPSDVDIILSITSIVHISKEELMSVLQKCVAALNSGGILFITCKEDEYHTEVEERDGVERRFYYYETTDIVEALPEEMEIIDEEHESFGGNKFLNVTIRKV